MSIVETHPAAAPTTITHELSITGDAAESLWEAYRLNFEPLAELAVLQHFYSRDEMLAELANPRIIKIIGWQDGVPIGLAMVTNSLEDVPQISPAVPALEVSGPRRDATRIYVGILVMVLARSFAAARCSPGFTPSCGRCPRSPAACSCSTSATSIARCSTPTKLAQRIADQLPPFVGPGARSSDVVRGRAARSRSPDHPAVPTASLSSSAGRWSRPRSGGVSARGLRRGRVPDTPTRRASVAPRSPAPPSRTGSPAPAVQPSSCSWRACSMVSTPSADRRPGRAPSPWR